MPWFDETSRRPFLAFSCQPDPVGPKESNPPQGPPQLLESPDADHGGKVGQDALVPGVNNSPAAHLQGKVVGGAALPLEVVRQPLIPASLAIQGSLEGVAGVPRHIYICEYCPVLSLAFLLPQAKQ